MRYGVSIRTNFWACFLKHILWIYESKSSINSWTCLLSRPFGLVSLLARQPLLLQIRLFIIVGQQCTLSKEGLNSPYNSVGLGGLKNAIWCMLILLQDWRRLLVRTQIVDILYFHHRALQLFSQFNIVDGFESYTCVCRLSCQHQCNYCQVQLCLLLCIVSAYLSHFDTLLLFFFIFTSEQCMGALGYYNKNDKYHN